MRALAPDLYIRRISYYYLFATLVSFIWLIIIFGYASRYFLYVDSFMGLRKLLVSKFVFLIVYLAFAIAILLIYRYMLRNSDNFIQKLKRYGVNSDWQGCFINFTKKRNRLLTTNLFILLSLYVFLVNYGLNYNKIGQVLPAYIIIPVLGIIVMVDFVLSSRRLHVSSGEVYSCLNKVVYENEPQLDNRFWKCSYLYINTSDPRVIVNRRSGIGWAVNHAHIIPAVLWYTGVLLILTAVVTWV